MNWLGQRDLAAAGAVRLFCLPHAGSGSAVFHRWKRLLPASIAVCPVALPGREMRLEEPLRQSMGVLAEELAGQLSASPPDAPPHRSALDRPYAIFGHSMGALLACELVRRLELAGARRPEWLFVSGRDAPQPEPSVRKLHRLPDEAFIDALQRHYGGVPPGFLDDAELRQVFLPILRADLTAVETYRWPAGTVLHSSIMALSGAADTSVSPAGLARWQHLTEGDFLMERFPGGHFYHLEQGQAQLLRRITDLLES